MWSAFEMGWNNILNYPEAATAMMLGVLLIGAFELTKRLKAN